MGRSADDSRVWKMRIERVRPDGSTDSILEYHSSWSTAITAAKKHAKIGDLLYFGEYKQTKIFRVNSSEREVL